MELYLGIYLLNHVVKDIQVGEITDKEKNKLINGVG
jgi:hypothetical protein